jgi:hypothetical protein
MEAWRGRGTVLLVFWTCDVVVIVVVVSAATVVVVVGVVA